MNAGVFFPLLFLFMYLVFKIYQKINKKAPVISTATKPLKSYKNYSQSNSTTEDNQKIYNSYNSNQSKTILSKIIDNDNTLDSIVDDFEARKQKKAQELEERLGKALPNDVIWGILQDIYSETFIRNHKVLLNTLYQQGLLVQKEKRYKQAIAHYAYGLYYLMNFYNIPFNPTAHIIDYVTNNNQIIEMAQEKFINKIRLCMKYENVEIDEAKNYSRQFIDISPLPNLDFNHFFTTIESHLLPIDDKKNAENIQNQTFKNLGFSSEHDDLFEGLKFSAALQLRTPLEVLKHHGEIHKGSDNPPEYAKEIWHGIWLPKLKEKYRLITDRTIATDIGQLSEDKAKDYYEFLLKFHTIVENEQISAEEKITQLKKLYQLTPRYNSYFDSKRFESYLKLLISDNFSSNVAKSLKEAGFRTLKDLKGANLEYLGTLNGIGKATLEKLKPYVNVQ